MQSVGLSHLSLDAVSVYGLLKLAAGNGKQYLMVLQAFVRQIKHADRKKFIRHPLIEQRANQLFAAEAFVSRESMSHNRGVASPSEKSGRGSYFGQKVRKAKEKGRKIEQRSEAERRAYCLCLLSSETDNFFLPLALRRAMTARPLGVSMRERKPCLFLLLRCEG